MDKANTLTVEDFVIYKENGQIMSGGYTVDSILLNQNRAPIYSSNKSQKGGDSVSSSLFSDLAVPGGLLFTVSKNDCKKYDTVHNNTTNDNLFDNLLQLLHPKNKKNHNLKTRKNKNKIKLTRKHKI
tara:strand:- start:431 stop:811 length:381 start_codon:yes stop_codon:yes gene_type:complete